MSRYATAHQRRILAPDEYKRRRRERRMGRTARLEDEVREWAEQRGCWLRVLNDGHHWLFQKAGFMAEWWPSSAKLAVNRDYLHDHHAPHWRDAVAVLETHFTPAIPGPAKHLDLRRADVAAREKGNR